MRCWLCCSWTCLWPVYSSVTRRAAGLAAHIVTARWRNKVSTVLHFSLPPASLLMSVSGSWNLAAHIVITRVTTVQACLSPPPSLSWRHRRVPLYLGTKGQLCRRAVSCPYPPHHSVAQCHGTRCRLCRTTAGALRPAALFGALPCLHDPWLVLMALFCQV